MKNNNLSCKLHGLFLLTAFSMVQGCHLLPPPQNIPRAPVFDDSRESLVTQINNTMALTEQQLVAGYQAINAIPREQRSAQENILLAILLTHEKLPQRNLERALMLLSAEQKSSGKNTSTEQLAALLYQLIQRQQTLEKTLAETQTSLASERDKRTTLENQLRALKEVETGIIRRESNQPMDATPLDDTSLNSKSLDKGAP